MYSLCFSDSGRPPGLPHGIIARQTFLPSRSFTEAFPCLAALATPTWASSTPNTQAIVAATHAKINAAAEPHVAISNAHDEPATRSLVADDKAMATPDAAPANSATSCMATPDAALANSATSCIATPDAAPANSATSCMATPDAAFSATTWPSEYFNAASACLIAGLGAQVRASHTRTSDALIPAKVLMHQSAAVVPNTARFYIQMSVAAAHADLIPAATASTWISYTSAAYAATNPARASLQNVATQTSAPSATKATACPIAVSATQTRAPYTHVTLADLHHLKHVPMTTNHHAANTFDQGADPSNCCSVAHAYVADASSRAFNQVSVSIKPKANEKVAARNQIFSIPAVQADVLDTSILCGAALHQQSTAQMAPDLQASLHFNSSCCSAANNDDDDDAIISTFLGALTNGSQLPKTASSMPSLAAHTEPLRIFSKVFPPCAQHGDAALVDDLEFPDAGLLPVEDKDMAQTSTTATALNAASILSVGNMDYSDISLTVVEENDAIPKPFSNATFKAVISSGSYTQNNSVSSHTGVPPTRDGDLKDQQFTQAVVEVFQMSICGLFNLSLGRKGGNLSISDMIRPQQSRNFKDSRFEVKPRFKMKLPNSFYTPQNFLIDPG